MSTTPVSLYDPRIQVTLYKLVGRSLVGGDIPASERYRSTPTTIDLTPYLGEGSGVRVSKSLNAPAGGWTITLADKPAKNAGVLETLYGLVEPMDGVEIRMRHGPGGTRPPVMMRGFVSSVERAENMGADGKPNRIVVLSGQDYGKIWQQLQILYFPSYVVGEDIISSFRLFERFGVGFETAMPVDHFVREVAEKIINPYLEKLMPERPPMPAGLSLDIQVAEGVTSITGPQNQEGPIYDLLRAYTDVGPWNELFIEDRDDAPYLVFRPNPYFDLSGKLIQGGKQPTIIDLPMDDVLHIHTARTDANVANFYWTRAPRFDLNTDLYRQLFAIGGADRATVLLDGYPNSRVDLYGTRVMHAHTQLGPNEVVEFTSGLPEAPDTVRSSAMSAWVRKRRVALVESNKDNVVLESGTIRCRGNEAIQAGTYVRLQRGAMPAIYYVVAVQHDFAPFRAWTMTLQLERGMGFVERIRKGAPGSPYVAERRAAR